MSQEVIKTNKKYLTPTFIYEEAHRRLQELKQAANYYENRKKKWPEENIHISRRNSNVQYYLREKIGDGNGRYISKKNTEIISKYINKKYEKEVLKLIYQEIDNIEEFMLKADKSDEIIRNKYSDNPDEIKSYINPIDISDDDYVSEWLSEIYESKQINNNQTIWTTEKGEIVRSKSELNIANMLYRRGIPYKYERPLVLKGGVTIHPDFTVLNVAKRKEIYWEHRGMMDDRGYARDAVQRIKDYNRNNIILGDNLIITEETSNVALGTDEIERIIKHYLI